jgi:hypothetical protein
MSESTSQHLLSRVHGRWVRLFVKIKFAAASSALSVLTALTLRSTAAVAQEQAGTQSVEIFGGEQFGDNLTDARSSPTRSSAPVTHGAIWIPPSWGSTTAGLWCSPTATASQPMRASVPSTIRSTISMSNYKLAIAISIDSSATPINI